MKRNLPALLLALGTGLTAGVAQTAQAVTTLSVGFQAILASEGNAKAFRENGTSVSEGGPYFVSVNPNNQSYASNAANLAGTSAANRTSAASDAPDFQRPIVGPIQARRWVGGGTNGVLTQNGQTDGSPRISYTTTDVTNPVTSTFDSFAQDQLRIWTTNDPGADLLNPLTTRNAVGPGYRSFGDVTATLDISGLGTGTAYIFYGSFSATPTLSVVMRDLDGAAPDLVIGNAHLNGDRAERGEYYIAEIDYSTDGIYDVIQYTWLGNGLNNTGNGRFGGTVLTGNVFVAPPAVPEPATATLGLLALGGLIMRRRRMA